MVGVKRAPVLEIKLILCPLDFSEFSIRAYQHALSLAEHYRAKLVALDVVEPFQHSYLGFATSALLYDEACRALRESSRSNYRNSSTARPPKEIQTEVVVELRSAADGTLSFARAHKVFGSTTYRVIQAALPGPGCSQPNSTMDPAASARLRSAEVLFAISPTHCRSYSLFREQRIRRQQVLPVL